MLTEKQQQNLLPFLNHEKYGRILRDAIIQWKTYINPKFNSFGIVMRNSIYEVNCESCCLLGGALIGKEGVACVIDGTSIMILKNSIHSNFRLDLDLSKYFDLSSTEIDDIYHGFDYNMEFNTKGEAFKFGLGVRRALLE